MGAILQNAIQKGRRLREYLRIQSKNIYEVNEKYPFTKDQIMKALRFAVASNATDYRVFHEVQPHLRGVMSYLMGTQGYQPAQELLAVEQDALWMTPKYVLFMYQGYLQKVVPTNITFYHFMREKQFYTHFVALRYVMVVGLAQVAQQKHIFMKLKHHTRVDLFRLLLEWLLTLIYYRCSAIYINSNCVDPLIKQTHLLLSALVGFDHVSILTSLVQTQIQDVFNKLLYMNGFLLSTAVSKKDYLQMSIILAVIRKLLTSISRQNITTYLPSYLYAHLIGFIPAPYTHKIVHCLLVYFVTFKYHHKHSTDSVDSLVQQNQAFVQSLIVDCWSILSLLTEQYQFDQQIQAVTKNLILLVLPKLQSKSMIRGFVTRIIHNMRLDSDDENLARYVVQKRQPYLIENKVLKIEVFCKNYLIAKQNEYLWILREGAKGREAYRDEVSFWRTLTGFNTFEIESRQDYMKNHFVAGEEAT